MNIGQTKLQGSSPLPATTSASVDAGSVNTGLSAAPQGAPTTVSAALADANTAKSPDNPGEDALTKALEKLGVAGKRNDNVRLSLDVDKPSGRVIGRLIDRDTGELVEQFPPERTLEILAGIREMVGYVVDERV